MCCRKRILSGRRERCCRNEARRLHQYSGRSETLAWAAPDEWFSHLAIEVPGENSSNEWLEPVSDEEYGKLQ